MRRGFNFYILEYMLYLQVSSCLGELSDLNSQYEAVSQKTTELHVACQDLLKVCEVDSIAELGENNAIR